MVSHLQDKVIIIIFSVYSGSVILPKIYTCPHKLQILCRPRKYLECRPSWENPRLARHNQQKKQCDEWCVHTEWMKWDLKEEDVLKVLNLYIVYYSTCELHNICCDNAVWLLFAVTTANWFSLSDRLYHQFILV